MTKRYNRFLISLDFGFVPHHCRAIKRLIYSHDVNENVRLRGDIIQEICFDWPQHGTITEMLS